MIRSRRRCSNPPWARVSTNRPSKQQKKLFNFRVLDFVISICWRLSQSLMTPDNFPAPKDYKPQSEVMGLKRQTSKRRSAEGQPCSERVRKPYANPGVEVNRRIPSAANFPIRLSFPQQLLITLLIKRLAVGEISHRSRSERIA